MHKYICQVNNIKIYQVNDIGYKFMQVTPNGRTLDEFRYLSDAKLSATGIKDFIKGK